MRNHELTPFDKVKDMVRKTKVKNTPQVPKKIKSIIFLLTKNGVTMPAVNQATALLAKNSESIFCCPIESFLININLTLKRICQAPVFGHEFLKFQIRSVLL